MNDITNLYAVIMAGGKGARFWPVGCQKRPKQLVKFDGKKTMLEKTVQRVFPLLPPERIFILTNEMYRNAIADMVSLPKENIIGEPVGRDTAPCLALATSLIRRLDPAATMMVLPADHLIETDADFQQDLLQAVELAQTGKIVTLGVVPTRPATEYGYIHLGKELGERAHEVLDFSEKPDQGKAQFFLQQRSYRWNCGIFVWRCDVICDAFAKYVPALWEKIKAWGNGSDYAADFADCEAISIDYAILEKAKNIAEYDVRFRWSDMGNWGVFYNQMEKDASGNVVQGEVVQLDAQNSIVINADEHGVVGVIGVRNLVVIKSDDRILVCPLAEEQRVKELTKQIDAKWL